MPMYKELSVKQPRAQIGQTLTTTQDPLVKGSGRHLPGLIPKIQYSAWCEKRVTPFSGEIMQNQELIYIINTMPSELECAPNAINRPWGGEFP